MIVLPDRPKIWFSGGRWRFVPSRSRARNLAAISYIGALNRRLP